jgi:hypothetical protein
MGFCTRDKGVFMTQRDPRRIDMDSTHRARKTCPMIPRSELRVTVEELGSGRYCWSVLRRRGTSFPAECVSLSLEHFKEYDQALDAGFVKLQALSDPGATPPLRHQPPAPAWENSTKAPIALAAYINEGPPPM